MAKRMAEAVEKMDQRQQSINTQTTSFVEQLRQIVSSSQTETNKKMQQSLELVAQQVGGIVDSLRIANDQAIDANRSREELMAERTAAAVTSMTGSAESAAKDLAVASARMQDAVARIAQVTTTALDKMNYGRRGWRARTALALLAMASPGPSCGALVRWKVRDLAKDNPQVLYKVDTAAKAVALTIDDGPDPATTPAILDVLARNGAHATFFIITSRVPGNEGVLRRMLAEGHELGNHMLRDEPNLALPPAEFERQLRESHELLVEFVTIRWFRPGSGRYDARMLAALEPYNYRCALGSAYPFDPQIRWSWFSRRFILSAVQPGSVVILHDWGSKGRRTLKTLSSLLPSLSKRGYRVVTLGELDSLRGAPQLSCAGEAAR